MLGPRTVEMMVIPSVLAIMAGLFESERTLSTAENPNFWIWVSVAFAFTWSTCVAIPDLVRFVRNRFTV